MKKHRELIEVPYNKERIRPNEIRKSLVNPDIAHALTELSSKVLQKSWIVAASTDLISQFVVRTLRPVWSRLLLGLMEGLAWGHVGMEVIWGIRDVSISGKEVMSAIVPIDFKLLPPTRIRYLMDAETKEIVGFRLKGKNYYDKDIDYLDEKAMFYAYREFTAQSPYGFPLIALCKPYEEMINDMVELMAVWMENMVLPPIVGRAPMREVQLKSGQLVEATELLKQKIEELKSAGVAVIPQEYDQAGQPLWDVSILFSGSEGAQIPNVINILRSFIRASIMGTEAGQSGGTGFMSGQPSTDLGSSYIFMELLMAINKRLLKWLVYLNWGENEWAVLESPESGQTDINLVRDLIRTSIQFNPDARDMLLDSVDWNALLQMLGIPLSPEGKNKGDVLNLTEELQGLVSKESQAPATSPIIPQIAVTEGPAPESAPATPAAPATAAPAQPEMPAAAQSAAEEAGNQ